MADLSAFGQTSDVPHPQLEEVGAVGSRQEAAELLSSKLELLKADLLNVQQQLQRRSRERSMTQEVMSHPVRLPRLGCMADVGVCAQKAAPRPERPLATRLQRSSSVHEILSSPRNKLLRQSSLQQQKVNYAVSCCF